MPDYLNSSPTFNTYTDPTTGADLCGFGPNIDTDHITFDVWNNPVTAQLYVFSDDGRQTYLDVDPAHELQFPATTGSRFDRIAGIRFKSQNTNAPALIVAKRFTRYDAKLSPGLAQLGTLGSTGSITPPKTGVNIEYNGVFVGNEQSVNFQDSAAGQVSVTWTISDDSADGRVNVQPVIATNLGTFPQLLFSSVLVGTTAQFDTTGNSLAGFNTLLVVFQGQTTGAVTSGQVGVRFNNDGGANYQDQHAQTQGATVSSVENTTGLTSGSIGTVNGTGATALYPSGGAFLIPGYAGTTFHKIAYSFGGGSSAANAAGQITDQAMVHWLSTAAIARIQLFPRTGSWLAGSSIIVYGL